MTFCRGPTLACLLGVDGSLEKKSPTKRRALRGFLSVPGGSSSTDGTAAAKFFRPSMLAQDAYQVDSASERIGLGLDRARAGGKKVGHPPALTQEQVEQCRRMADEGSGLRHIARVRLVWRRGWRTRNGKWDVGAPRRDWRRQRLGAGPWDGGGPSPTTR